MGTDRWWMGMILLGIVNSAPRAASFDDRPDSYAFPAPENTVWENCAGPNYVMRAFLQGERVHWTKLKAVVTMPKNWRCISSDMRAEYFEVIRLNPALRLPRPSAAPAPPRDVRPPTPVPKATPSAAAKIAPRPQPFFHTLEVDPLLCENGAHKYLHLTFDDGPQAGLTDQVIKTLDTYNVRATFFLQGDKLADPALEASNRRLLGMMTNKHTLCSHTLHHVHSLDPGLSADDACQNIRDVYDLPLAAGLSRCVRMPYGQGYFATDQKDPRASAIKRCVKDLGLRHFLWNVDSEDWKGDNLATVLARLKKEICGASETKLIVLFHDTQKLTVQNLPVILEALSLGGHKFIGMQDVAPEVLKPAPRLRPAEGNWPPPALHPLEKGSWHDE